MPIRFDSPRFALLAIAVAAVLFLSVNVIANLWLGAWRLDATQGGAFTVSEQIKPVFAAIDEPITVRLYFSETLGEVSPRHAALYRRVRELLEQYAKLANGRLLIQYENPEPFSDTEDRAVGFGLQAVPLGRSGEVGYFGLAATNATDDQKVIPFFNLEREQFVEYDLTKLIYSLSKPNQAKIGLITSLPLEGSMGGMAMGMPGQPTPPWAILQQIKDFFDVRQLDAEVAEIPADIGMLLLAQPENLSPAAQYAIDQFVLRGGKVLAFVDPNAESGGGPMGATGGNLDGVKKLLAAWGVGIADGKIVGDLEHAVRVNTESNGRPIVSDYVAWLQLGAGNLDPNDAITGDLKQINFGTPGAIERIEGATTTVTPLVTTGPKSMRIDADKVQGLPDVVALFRDFKPAEKREVLAARITGPAKTAFPDGPPKPEAKADTKKNGAPEPASKSEPLKESKQSIQVVLVADSDVLADRFWLQDSQFFGQRVAVPTADNGGFVINALENLTGSPALSSLRGRGSQSRPFLLIEAIRRDAEREFRAKEQALQGRLDELQKKVSAIELRQGDNEQIQLSDADRISIENYRAEILSTRKELREVQRALRRDIDRIEGAVKFVNIALVPIVFGIIMVVAAALRRRRRAAAAG
jgi:ABC-type uncharacterized transport system involved in gliding motility auxiliary subunit